MTTPTERTEPILAYFDFPHENPRLSSWWKPTSPSLTRAHVTTWDGIHLGAITHARIYFGRHRDRRVALRANIGGVEYHGRASWDNGTCIFMRPLRSRTARKAS